MSVFISASLGPNLDSLFASIPKFSLVQPPAMPEFTLTESWKTFSDCLKIKSEEKFPNGLCRIFSSWTFLFLAMKFKGLLCGGHLQIEIDGAIASVVPLRTFSGFNNHYSDHYYLSMHLRGQDWVIDPSWKQFINKGDLGNYAQIDRNDCFNNTILSQYPDIMVAQHAEYMDFLENLRKSQIPLDPSTAKKLEAVKQFWINGTPKFAEFRELVSVFATEPSSFSAHFMYAIRDLELLWPILEVSCQTSCNLQAFCKSLQSVQL